MKPFLSRILLSALCCTLIGYGTAYAATKLLSNEYAWPFDGRDVSAELQNKIAVVELYTSETCAFCPNADKFFSDLMGKTNLIGFSCHVNYFSNKSQGLDRPICTTRQKQYAANLTGGMKYTPQMIINGRKESVGYYYTNVLTTILSDKTAIAPLAIQKGDFDEFSFNLPASQAIKNADIWLVAYAPVVTKKIKFGPNAGKTLSYTRPVTSIDKLASWTGDARTIKFTPNLKSSPAGMVVLVQSSSGIIAAGQFEF